MFLPQVSLVFFWGITVERSRSKIYSFKPQSCEHSKGAKRTKSSWLRRTLSMLLALIVIAMLVSMLSGCASSMRIESDKPLPISAEMSAQQSPGAKVFSEKVSSYLGKVEDYFSETPTFTTP